MDCMATCKGYISNYAYTSVLNYTVVSDQCRQ